MADQKITQLTEQTSPALEDLIVTVDDPSGTPVSKKMTLSNLLKILDGWVPAGETWTRTGNHTFTVSGDVTAKYRKGLKVRYKDGGSYEYGYVKSSSHSTGTTTVTLVTNADYAMASATITDNYISYVSNPEGFPHWFSFTTTWGGFSSNPTGTLYFQIEGTRCTFYIVDGSGGTSNATSLTFTVPVSVEQSYNNFGLCFVGDNGSNQTTPGHMSASSSSATISVYKTWFQGSFTSSGGKNVFIPATSYEWT